ncbi:MAG: YbaN family protein [Xanthomonadales bacterium]|nr:YbaN family protein [Xanthomonadales bacterium]
MANLRWPYVFAAYGFIAIGALGALLPVLPTTPFLLLALWAGANASPRLRFRLFRHPRYGATLRAWHRHRVVPPAAKWAACSLMSISALLLYLGSAPAWLLSVAFTIFILAAVFILGRPSHPLEKRQERQ